MNPLGHFPSLRYLPATLLVLVKLCSATAIATGFESALQFSGTTEARDHVEFRGSSNLQFADAITIETWIKVDGSNGDWQGLKWAPIVCKGNAWGVLRYLDTNRVTFRTDADGVLEDSDELVSATELSPDRWHHIAAVYDRSAGKKSLYIDGALDATADYTLALRDGPALIRIAANSEDPNAMFGGLIDDTRIWGAARSAEQIAEDRDRFIPRTSPNLVAAWSFQFNPGRPTRLDNRAAAGGLHGFLVGRALPVWVAGRPRELALGLRQDLAAPQFACVPVTAATEAAFDSITAGVTVEAWVKLDEVPTTTATVVSKGGGTWSLVIRPSGRATFNINGASGADASLSTPDHFPIGEWVHLAGTYDSASQRMVIYVNGFPVASEQVNLSGEGPPDPTLQTSDFPMFFGGIYDESAPDVPPICSTAPSTRCASGAERSPPSRSATTTSACSTATIPDWSRSGASTRAAR